MSARKSSHRTIFLIVSSGSPLALIASSLRSTSKNPVCPMARSLHPPMAHCGQRVRFVATWREEFFKVPASNWRDVAEKKEIKVVVQRRVDRRRSVDHEERVPVWCRLHDCLCSDVGAGARSVLDDERLAEALRELLAD